MRLGLSIRIAVTTIAVVSAITTIFISNKYLRWNSYEPLQDYELPQVSKKKGNHLPTNKHVASEHRKRKGAAGKSKEITKDALIIHSTTGQNSSETDHADGLRNATSKENTVAFNITDSATALKSAEIDGTDANISATTKAIDANILLNRPGKISVSSTISVNDIDNTTGPSENMNRTDKPLNILLLYADDWRHDTLGAAEGSSVIRTPFLDSLAKKGVRFRHNCVTTSICWISRVTLITGQFYSRHKQRLLGEGFNFLEYWNDTIPGVLRNNGYHVGHVGKWHLWKAVNDKYDYMKEYFGYHWIDEGNNKVHVTKKNELDSIEFLRTRPMDKPFCLTVAFYAPHAEDQDPEFPWKPQPESMHLYVNDTVPTAPSATKEGWEALPSFFDEGNEARLRWRGRFDTPENFQTNIKNYFRMASEVDSASQAIVQELEIQGLLNNTLVIFTTDNGFFLSEHGLSDKFYPHQESIRVPLIISDPRMSNDKIGTTNDDFTLSIDLAPTILSAAGLSPPARMQGRDMSVLYRNEGTQELEHSPWRTDFYYELPKLGGPENQICPNEALVQKDFKFINWTYHMQEQLFNLKNDPWELKDLINHPEHQTVLSQMRKRLLEWREAVK